MAHQKVLMGSLLGLLCACASGAGASDDGDGYVITYYEPQFNEDLRDAVLGVVLVNVTAGGGYADAWFRTSPTTGTDRDIFFYRSASVGECHLYETGLSVGESLCHDPHCPEDEWCAPGARCLPHGEDVSAGAVQVRGLAQDIALLPGDVAYQEAFFVEALTAQHRLVARAEGGDFPGFEVTAPGVEPLQAEMCHTERVLPCSAEVTDGMDLALDWTAVAPDRQIEIFLKPPTWHGVGLVTYISCVVPDTGHHDVPWPLLELMYSIPTIGGECDSASYIRRFSEQVVQTDVGKVRLQVQSVIGFNLYFAALRQYQ